LFSFSRLRGAAFSLRPILDEEPQGADLNREGVRHPTGLVFDCENVCVLSNSDDTVMKVRPSDGKSPGIFHVAGRFRDRGPRPTTHSPRLSPRGGSSTNAHAQFEQEQERDHDYDYEQEKGAGEPVCFRSPTFLLYNRFLFRA
jgi:hypothetical protein